MRVKLQVGKVINGAVWMKDSIVGEDIADTVEMQRWVDEGEAEIVDASATQSPSPQPSRFDKLSATPKRRGVSSGERDREE